MRKLTVCACAICAAAIVFGVGPVAGKFICRAATSGNTIAAWQTEFRELDNTFPQIPANEQRRVELCRKLAQRGIEIDPGIRDEAIDNNLTPYSLLVRIWWSWKELAGK